MKKYKLYLTIYADVEVNADTEEQAYEIVKAKYSKTELLANHVIDIDYCSGCEEIQGGSSK